MLLLPWADIGYACDFNWWARYHQETENPLKLTVDKKAATRWADVHLVSLIRKDQLELVAIGTVGWGGNSGFHALNLAVQMRPSKIILVGYDMTLAHGVHWHGKHPSGMNNPIEGNVARWRRCIDEAAEVIEALGIQAINASPISALERYPKMSLLEALDADPVV